MAHDVFICHSSKDKTVADAVCSVLESEGVRCWIAPRDVLAGLSYGEAIIDAINGARVMVIVFSSNANASPQIEREIERAVNRDIRVVQFRIEDVVPKKALEYFLSSPHWLDAFTPPLERHLKVLASQVRELLDRAGVTLGAPPSLAPEPALGPPPAPPAPPPRGANMGLVAGAIVLAGLVIAAALWFGVLNRFGGVSANVAAGPASTSVSVIEAPPSQTAPAALPPVAALPAAGTCIVADPTPTPLNIRMAPNGQILGAVSNGVAVRVLERQTVDGKAWTLIEPRGAGMKSGWVFSSYLNCG